MLGAITKEALAIAQAASAGATQSYRRIRDGEPGFRVQKPQRQRDIRRRDLFLPPLPLPLVKTNWLLVGGFGIGSLVILLLILNLLKV